WSQPPLSQPRKAIEHFRLALAFDAQAHYSIYSLRELYKAAGDWAEALPLFERELRLVDDRERRIALLADEADTLEKSGDLAGASVKFRAALDAEGGKDAMLK